MPAAPLTASERYFHRGKTKVYSVTSIADKANPLRAELNAGIDLSDEIQAMAGWMVSGNEIETPDLGTIFTGKIPGATSTDESSITCYADKGGVDVRTVLPRETLTNIVILYGGDVPGGMMDVFETRVRSNGKPVGVGDDAALVEVGFSILREPHENLEIPA